MVEGSMHVVVSRRPEREIVEDGGGGHHPIAGERARELSPVTADARGKALRGRHGLFSGRR
jgi:hypothetical protein